MLTLESVAKLWLEPLSWVLALEAVLTLLALETELSDALVGLVWELAELALEPEPVLALLGLWLDPETVLALEGVLALEAVVRLEGVLALEAVLTLEGLFRLTLEALERLDRLCVLAVLAFDVALEAVLAVTPDWLDPD